VLLRYRTIRPVVLSEGQSMTAVVDCERPVKRFILKLQLSALEQSGPHQQSHGALPMQIVPAVHNAMLVTSSEHRGVVRSTTGL
jgi:hypothetical protein